MTTARMTMPGSAAEVLVQVQSTANGDGPTRAALDTGFYPLDHALGGGLPRGGLTVVGGAPGIGKTVAALQWARHLARAGRATTYVCYEHDETELVLRLLVLEASILAQGQFEVLDQLQTALQEVSRGTRALTDVGPVQPLVDAAAQEINDYCLQLRLVAGSGRSTGAEQLHELVSDAPIRPEVLFVDYLQKVAVVPDPATEEEKIRRVTEGLKDLALDEGLGVVALAAADRAGIEQSRLRLHHLRGSTAIAYEADVVILLNDKIRVVSKSHLAYDATRAQEFKRQVVFTIEKNRRAEAGLDLEFRKNFSQFRFETEGQYVAERLIDERFDTE
jgi:replicative DNA helicase